MEKAQEELKTAYVEHSAGGGAVTVKVSGALEVADITIKPEAIDPDDPEMLQDLLVSAVNGAITRGPAAAAAEDDGPAGRHGRARPARLCEPAAVCTHPQSRT